MSENVNGSDLFGSGGHVWTWAEPVQSRKDLRTVGTSGQAGWPIQTGGREGLITGKGAGGLLKAAGNDRAAADAALDVLEKAIEDLWRAGTVCAWADDQGHSGSGLQIAGYRRLGRREYSKLPDTTWRVWQRYQCRVLELSGTILG